MKPAKVVGGIVAVTLLLTGSFGLRLKLKYDEDERVIKKLIAEYKAMGVPTNGDEFFHPIPDSENAWIEIGPTILTKVGKGTGPLFRSALASDFILTTNKADMPLLRKYLKANEAKRAIIERALASKPRMQVPHNYDEGYMMLLPELAVIKAVGRDFCLAAYVAGLEGDADGVKRNLDVVNTLANECTKRGEIISSYVGLAIRKEEMLTALRLAEVTPNLIPMLDELMTKPGRMAECDPKRMMECEFMAQIVTARFMDSPLMDRKTFPAPLDKLVKPLDFKDIESIAHVRKGDHMPESHTVRTYVRKRLEAWMPLFQEMKKAGLPEYKTFDKAFNMYEDMPKAMELLGSMSGDFKDMYENIGLDRQNNDVFLAVWKAKMIHTRTGKYPASLSETGVKIRSLVPGAEFEYVADDKGVDIRSVRINKDSGMPWIQMSYPAFHPSAVSLSSKRQKLTEYKQGKIDETGSNKSRRVIHVPPGVPKPVR